MVNWFLLNREPQGNCCSKSSNIFKKISWSIALLRYTVWMLITGLISSFLSVYCFPFVVTKHYCVWAEVTLDEVRYILSRLGENKCKVASFLIIWWFTLSRNFQPSAFTVAFQCITSTRIGIYELAYILIFNLASYLTFKNKQNIWPPVQSNTDEGMCLLYWRC